MKYLISKYFKDNELEYPMYQVWDSKTLMIMTYMHTELLGEIDRNGLILENVTRDDIVTDKVRNFSFANIDKDFANLVNTSYGGMRNFTYGGMRNFTLPLAEAYEDMAMQYNSLKYSIFTLPRRNSVFQAIVLYFHGRLFEFTIDNLLMDGGGGGIIGYPIYVNEDKMFPVSNFDFYLYGYDHDKDIFNIYFCHGSEDYVGQCEFKMIIYSNGFITVADLSKGNIMNYQNDRVCTEADFRKAVNKLKLRSLVE